MQAFCTELAHAHVSLKAIFEAHIYIFLSYKNLESGGKKSKCYKPTNPESFGAFCITNESKEQLFLPKERQGLTVSFHCYQLSGRDDGTANV